MTIDPNDPDAGRWCYSCNDRKLTQGLPMFHILLVRHDHPVEGDDDMRAMRCPDCGQWLGHQLDPRIDNPVIRVERIN